MSSSEKWKIITLIINQPISFCSTHSSLGVFTICVWNVKIKMNIVYLHVKHNHKNTVLCLRRELHTRTSNLVTLGVGISFLVSELSPDSCTYVRTS